MAESQSSGKSDRSLHWLVILIVLNQNTASCLSRPLSRGKAVSIQLDAKGKGTCFSIFFFLSSEKRPSRLTAPFILYYPAWLLTPGELCSQIDALLLWGCSWNIKLYWNIHMWVHLAESNWCATPQGPDGNVAGPRHVQADTLSSGRDSDCDLAQGTESNYVEVCPTQDGRGQHVHWRPEAQGNQWLVLNLINFGEKTGLVWSS